MFIEGLLGAVCCTWVTSLISPQSKSCHPHCLDRKLQLREEKLLAQGGTARRYQSQDLDLGP